MHFNNNQAVKMVVNSNLKIWEVNMMRSIASLIQADIRQNGVKMPTSSANGQIRNETSAYYTTYEPTVTGHCKTSYLIGPLQKALVQSTPDLIPLPELNGNQNSFAQVVKKKDYSKCLKLPSYSFGLENYNAGANRIANFLTRSSESRITITLDNSRENYTIQSSISEEQIIVKPNLESNVRGLVASVLNLTILETKSDDNKKWRVNNAVSRGLVYDFRSESDNEKPIDDDDDSQSSSEERSSNIGSINRSSISSSEENKNNRASLIKRPRRSIAASRKDMNDLLDQRNSTMNKMTNEMRQKMGSGNNKEEASSSSSSSETHDSLSKNINRKHSRDSGEPNKQSNTNNKYYTENTSSSGSGENGSRFSSTSNSSRKSSHSSESSSSSEERDSLKPRDDGKPFLPFMPYFIILDGKSIDNTSEIDALSSSIEIAQQITDDLQGSKSLSERDTMSKYLLLNDILATMNQSRLEQLVKLTYVNQTTYMDRSQSSVLRWNILLNSITNTGSASALKTIFNLIKENKVVTNEAAEIVSRLPHTAKTEDSDYLNAFYNMVTSQNTLRQKYLNNTALVAFSNIIKNHQNSPVADKYFKFLNKNLREAIKQNDQNSDVLYILVAAFTNHKDLVENFQDLYQNLTHYQRLIMINSLYRPYIANNQDAKQFIKSVYENPNEDDIIQASAANILIKANPDLETLKYLASQSNVHPKNIVRSVIRTSIRSAANNLDHTHNNLASKARIAIRYLDDNSNDDFKDSMSIYSALFRDDAPVRYENYVTLLRNHDSLFPALIKNIQVENKNGIYGQEEHNAVFISTINQLLKNIGDQFIYNNQDDSADNEYDDSDISQVKRINKLSQNNSKRGPWNYSAKDIADLLDVKISNAPEVQVAMVYSLLGGKRIQSYGDQSIDSMAQVVQRIFKNHQNMTPFEKTSVYNQQEIIVGFPTLTGLPFVYSNRKPTMIHVNGQIMLQSNPDISNGNGKLVIPKTMNMTLSLQSSISRDSQTEFGFTAPFNQRKYMTGLIKHVEGNLDINHQLDVDVNNNNIRLAFSPKDNGKNDIFVLETIPYSTIFNGLEFETALNQRRTETVHARKPYKTATHFGKRSTGMMFRYETMSEAPKEDYNFFDFSIFNFNKVSSLPFPLVDNGVKANRVSLTFDQDASVTDQAQIEISLTNKYFNNGQIKKKEVPEADYKKAKPSSDDAKKIMDQFTKIISEEVQNPSVSAVGVQAKFSTVRSQTEYNILAVATYGSNDIRNYTSTLLYYGLNPKNGINADKYEVCASGVLAIPRVRELNSFEAFKNNPNSTFNTSVVFGESCDNGFHLEKKVYMSQSQTYRQQLKKTAIMNQCLKDFERGETTSYTCQTVSRLASKIDTINVNVEKSWDKNMMEPTSLLFSPISVYLQKMNLNYDYQNEISSEPLSSKKLQVEARISENLEYVNITALHKNETTKFLYVMKSPNNMVVNPISLVSTAINTIHDLREERLGWPSCSIGKTVMHTFDNSSLNFLNAREIAENHLVVALLYTPQKIDMQGYENHNDVPVNYGDQSLSNNVAVLFKDVKNKRQVQLILGEYNIILDGKLNININNASIMISADRVYAPNRDENYIKIYAKHHGEINIDSRKYGLKVLFDGVNLQIYSNSQYMDNVRGVCGANRGSGKQRDLIMPNNRQLVEPDATKFFASYILTNGKDSPTLNNLQKKAANTESYKPQTDHSKTVYRLNRIKSNRRTNKIQSQSIKTNDILSYGKNENIYSSTDSTVLKSKYIVFSQQHEVCFSKHPVPECRNKLDASQIIKKEIPFVCKPISPNTEFFMQQIDDDKKVNLVNEQENRIIEIDLPYTCNSTN